MRKKSCTLKTGFILKIAATTKKGHSYDTTFNPSNSAVSCGLSGKNSFADEIKLAKERKAKIKVLDKDTIFVVCRREFINLKFLNKHKDSFGMNGHFDKFVHDYGQAVQSEIDRLIAIDKDKYEEHVANLQMLLK